MLARQRGGRVFAGRLDQRTQAGPDAGDIVAGGIARQIARGGFQDEVDVVILGARLQRQVTARRVGGADDGVAVPGHQEQHAAVVGLGHQDRAIAGQEAARQRQVYALAGRDHHLRALVLHAPYRVDPDAGGIDHAFGMQRQFGIAELVAHRDAADQARLHHETGHAGIVQRDTAQIEQRAHQRDREARVVELAVEIQVRAAQRPAADMLGQRRRRVQCLLVVEPAAVHQVAAAGQHVVDLQADAVEGLVEQLIGGHHEAQRPHQVRRVARQHTALLQRLAHQPDIALGQVTHAAMHQLGGLARGALGEVGGLQQQRAVAARGGIDRGAESGRAAPDHDHVPAALALQRGEQRRAIRGQGRVGCLHGKESGANRIGG